MELLGKGREEGRGARDAGGQVDGLQRDQRRAACGGLDNTVQVDTPIGSGAQHVQLERKRCNCVGNIGGARQLDYGGVADAGAFRCNKLNDGR